MKRLSATCVCVAMSLCATAQESALVVTTRNMGEVVIALSEKPVISFTDTEVVLRSSDVTLSYPLSEHVRLSVGVKEMDAVQETKNLGTSVRCKSSLVEITNAAPAIVVGLYGVDGRMLQTGKTDDTGRSVLKLDGKGVFVVRVGKLSVKISN